MSVIQYFRLKCKECGNKFTMSAEHSCLNCKQLGIECRHKQLCLRCFQDKMFYSTLIAISMVSFYALGGKLL